MSNKRSLHRNPPPIRLEAPGRKAERLPPSEVNITREIEYIIVCAERGDGRLVTLGPVVLFSTPEGDAWLLDAEDRLALCLVQDYIRQDFEARDTETQFYIRWQADFDIINGAFAVIFPDGTVSFRHSYPVGQIQEALRMAEIRRNPS